MSDEVIKFERLHFEPFPTVSKLSREYTAVILHTYKTLACVRLLPLPLTLSAFTTATTTTSTFTTTATITTYIAISFTRASTATIMTMLRLLMIITNFNNTIHNNRNDIVTKHITNESK